MFPSNGTDVKNDVITWSVPVTYPLHVHVLCTLNNTCVPHSFGKNTSIHYVKWTSTAVRNIQANCTHSHASSSCSLFYNWNVNSKCVRSHAKWMECLTKIISSSHSGPFNFPYFGCWRWWQVNEFSKMRDHYSRDNFDVECITWKVKCLLRKLHVF